MTKQDRKSEAVGVPGQTESGGRLLGCSGGILVEKFGPVEVRPGARFSYRVELTNTSGRAIESIVLVESLLSLLEIESASPASQLREPHTGRWLLGPVQPDERIVVEIVCGARKKLRFRSHTLVSYSS